MGIIIYLLLDMEKSRSLKEKVIAIVKYGTLWVLGYGLTWGTKWILTDIFYGKSIVSTSIGEIFFRLGNTIDHGYKEGYEVNAFLAVCENLKQISIPIFAIIILSIIAIFACILKNRNNTENIKNKVKDIVQLVIILFLPFFRYILLVNQSYQHAVFTYREMFFTVLSMLICIYQLLYNKEEERKYLNGE